MQLTIRSALLSLLPCLAMIELGPTAQAQMGAFQTPGQPQRPTSGQVDRFSNEFNPAIGGVVDFLGTWLDADGLREDGLELNLRSAEITVNTWIDPNTWAYAVLVGEPEEGIALEEAAVIYQGFDGNGGLRVGRFFVDFGKQMQAHPHDLPTFERPLVLRTYLGEELGGSGVQYDNWFAAGDSGAIRYSFGIFDSLAGGHEHGGEEEEGPEPVVADFQDIDEVSFTSRITGFHDVAENGVLQWGLSARGLPDFALDATLDDGSSLASDGLSNYVWGADLTYGWNDDSGLSGWTLGGEFLLFDGDLGGEVNDNGTPGIFADDTLDVLNDSRTGLYVWGERALNAEHSLGLLYSAAEHPEFGTPDETETVAYYSRNLSEFSRLRFGLRFAESDEDGDSTALLVQFTNFFGSHAHGVNW